MDSLLFHRMHDVDREIQNHQRQKHASYGIATTCPILKKKHIENSFRIGWHNMRTSNPHSACNCNKSQSNFSALPLFTIVMKILWENESCHVGKTNDRIERQKRTSRQHERLQNMVLRLFRSGVRRALPCQKWLGPNFVCGTTWTDFAGR